MLLGRSAVARSRAPRDVPWYLYCNREGKQRHLRTLQCYHQHLPTSTPQLGGGGGAIESGVGYGSLRFVRSYHLY